MIAIALGVLVACSAVLGAPSPFPGPAPGPFPQPSQYAVGGSPISMSGPMPQRAGSAGPSAGAGASPFFGGYGGYGFPGYYGGYGGCGVEELIIEPYGYGYGYGGGYGLGYPGLYY